MVDVTITYDNAQFFIIIMSVIWLSLVAFAYKKDDSVLLWLQFIIQMPLSIYLLGNTFIQGLDMGTGLGIGVLIASVYLAVLGSIVSKKKSKN